MGVCIMLYGIVMRRDGMKLENIASHYYSLMPCINTQYFGKDAEDFLESINYHSTIEYLGKECTVKGKQGIIIGIEDNEEYEDYYYIIYIPEDKVVYYQMVNDSKFIETIIL